MFTIKWFLVRRARYTPAILLIAAMALAATKSLWWLLAIPFIAIGSLFTAPNLNLANGMPSYASMMLGLILIQFHKPSGFAVFVGSAAAFYGAALEMRILGKPMSKE